MRHGSEIEIKLAVTNLAAARRKIRSLDFVQIIPRHFESNMLYDFADLRLRASRCLLRLRRANREWWLTFKGPPEASVRYKSRPEMETRIEDGKQLEMILGGLGLERTFQYDKYRTVFAPRKTERGAKGALLVLDETPVGNYLELEGPEVWIDRTAERLGYRREDYITASYGALYRTHCEVHGIVPADMVFKTRAD
jgi:adenylate cyclase, class 2